MKMTLSICDCLPLTSGQGRSQEKHDSSRFTAVSHRSWQCFPDHRRAGLLVVPRSNVLVVFTRFPTFTARDATSTSKKEIRTSTFSSALKRLSSRHDYEQFSQFSSILEDIRSDQRWYASVLAIFTLCREDGFHEVDFWSRVVRHTASLWWFCSCAVNFFEYVRLLFILKSKALTYWFQWC